MDNKRIQKTAVNSTAIWAVLYLFTLSRLIGLNPHPKFLVAYFLIIFGGLILGGVYAYFIEDRGNAKKQNEKPTYRRASLILPTLICLSPVFGILLDFAQGPKQLIFPALAFSVFLIIASTAWMRLLIQTDSCRRWEALWTICLFNKFAGKSDFDVIKKSRHKAEAGDVFLLRLKGESEYYYGRIFETQLMGEEKEPLVDGCHVMLVFPSKTNTLTMDALKLDYNGGFVGPFIVSNLYWRKGYFLTVGNLPLSQEEKTLDVGFVEELDEAPTFEYYNKHYRAILVKPRFVGPSYFYPALWLCDFLKETFSGHGTNPTSDDLEKAMENLIFKD